jgi:hypothetical protein
MTRGVNTLVDILNQPRENIDFGMSLTPDVTATPLQNIGAPILKVAATSTGTNTSGDIVNTHSQGGIFILNVGGVSSGTDVSMTINGKDLASNTYYNIAKINAATSASNGNYRVIIYAGVSGGIQSNVLTSATSDGNSGPGIFVNQPLPRTFQVQVTVSASATAAVSYTVGSSLID